LGEVQAVWNKSIAAIVTESSHAPE